MHNYGFEIERSSFQRNGTSPVRTEWENIGFVEGHGNSNSPKEYSFIDLDKLSEAVKYRLKQIDNDGNFEYSDVVTVEPNLLSKTKLFQNYPNPFNPSTQISFTVADVGLVNISIYNALGAKVLELLNKSMNVGTHNVVFNATNLASGFYFYRLETQNYSQTMKMLLLK